MINDVTYIIYNRWNEQDVRVFFPEQECNPVSVLV